MVDIVRTQTDLLTSLFQDNQATGAITEQDLRDLIVSLRANQGDGWVFHVDSQTTEPGSDNLVADARVAITNDGGSSISQTGHAGLIGGIWNTTNNYMTPIKEGDAYDVRVTFNFKPSAATVGEYIHFDLDIGAGGIGSGPMIYQEIRPLLKGSGIESHFAFSIPMFAMPPFSGGNGTFFITPSVPGKIWNVRMYFVRTYTPTT